MPEGQGSNAYALGREVTKSGRGVLLGNPHYPWTTTDRFYQAHLTVPGRYDAMGVIIGGGAPRQQARTARGARTLTPARDGRRAQRRFLARQRRLANVFRRRQNS